ncbi:hypothetical protein J6590_045269 [Homalodisca vitripennis]|nr:hypothetical protein J6590_045269 [Homalodisca vitripennis]
MSVRGKEGIPNNGLSATTERQRAFRFNYSGRFESNSIPASDRHASEVLQEGGGTALLSIMSTGEGEFYVVNLRARRKARNSTTFIACLPSRSRIRTANKHNFAIADSLLLHTDSQLGGRWFLSLTVRLHVPNKQRTSTMAYRRSSRWTDSSSVCTLGRWFLSLTVRLHVPNKQRTSTMAYRRSSRWTDSSSVCTLGRWFLSLTVRLHVPNKQRTSTMAYRRSSRWTDSSSVCTLGRWFLSLTVRLHVPNKQRTSTMAYRRSSRWTDSSSVCTLGRWFLSLTVRLHVPNKQRTSTMAYRRSSRWTDSSSVLTVRLHVPNKQRTSTMAYRRSSRWTDSSSVCTLGRWFLSLTVRLHVPNKQRTSTMAYRRSSRWTDSSSVCTLGRWFLSLTVRLHVPNKQRTSTMAYRRSSRWTDSSSVAVVPEPHCEVTRSEQTANINNGIQTLFTGDVNSSLLHQSEEERWLPNAQRSGTAINPIRLDNTTSSTPAGQHHFQYTLYVYTVLREQRGCKLRSGTAINPIRLDNTTSSTPAGQHHFQYTLDVYTVPRLWVRNHFLEKLSQTREVDGSSSCLLFPILQETVIFLALQIPSYSPYFLSKFRTIHTPSLFLRKQRSLKIEQFYINRPRSNDACWFGFCVVRRSTRYSESTLLQYC